MMMMKRSFHEAELDSITMANCLMLLSQGKEIVFPSFEAMKNSINNNNNPPSRVFECKTCNRQFPSFQALGGHRASHKKPKLIAGGEGSSETQSSSSFSSSSSPVKPKTHECSICGVEFAIGQALGGHMRRHRAVLNNSNNNNNNDHQMIQNSSGEEEEDQIMGSQPMKKLCNNNGRRGRILSLDLNLTPFENDLQLFRLNVGKTAPMVDCFF